MNHGNTDAEASLKAHSQTSYFKETFGVLQNLIDGAPEIEIYDEVAGLSK
jgi:quinol monooxygenase YgiN